MLRVWAMILVGAALAGCSKKGEIAPLAVEKIPSMTTNVFRDAKAPLRQMAYQAADQLSRGQYVPAWSVFRALMTRQDLNADQRAFAARAVNALAPRVDEAAAKGDAAAARMLQGYGVGK